jgi:hypothetical protein
MKLTITIEDEHGAATLVERPAAGAQATTPIPPAATQAEKPTSAGGPPPWLVEELEGGEMRPEAAGAVAGSEDVLDAGASKATGNGFVAMPG